MSESKSSNVQAPSTGRISSPEQLTDYLRVTRPGVWVILTAVILLLGGIVAWSTVGTLKTRTAGWAIVENRRAQVMVDESVHLEAGMPVLIGEQEYAIAAIETGELERTVGIVELPLPDGVFECTVVTEQIHPISFLLKSF